MIDWVEATDPIGVGVRAGYTSRLGGTSTDAYLSANMSTHVGDVETHVRETQGPPNGSGIADLAVSYPPFHRWLHIIRKYYPLEISMTHIIQLKYYLLGCDGAYYPS